MCLQRFVKIRSQTAMDNPIELTVFQETRTTKRSNSEVSAEHDREPVEDLGNREKADSKAEPTNPSNVRYEVNPSHLL